MKSNVVFACVAACSMGALALLAAADPAPGMYGPPTKVVISDSSITSSIQARFESDRVGGLSRVRVETEDHGVVTLEGHTETQDAADRAIAIAKATDGVREVRSDIEVEEDN